MHVYPFPFLQLSGQLPSYRIMFYPTCLVEQRGLCGAILRITLNLLYEERK